MGPVGSLEQGPTLRELADTDATGGSCAGAGRDGFAFYACLWPWKVVVAPEHPTQVQEGWWT